MKKALNKFTFGEKKDLLIFFKKKYKKMELDYFISINLYMTKIKIDFYQLNL